MRIKAGDRVKIISTEHIGDFRYLGGSGKIIGVNGLISIILLDHPIDENKAVSLPIQDLDIIPSIELKTYKNELKGIIDKTEELSSMFETIALGVVESNPHMIADINDISKNINAIYHECFIHAKSWHPEIEL